MENKFKKYIKPLLCVVCTFVVFVALGLVFYLKALPAIVSSQRVANYVVKLVKEQTGADLVLKNISLQTSLKPEILFQVGFVKLTKDDKNILVVAGSEADISFAEIFKKTIELKRLGSSFIYVDANKLAEILPEQKQEEQKPMDWKVKWFESLLYIKKIKVVYKYEDLDIDVEGTGLTIADRTNPKNVRFFVKAAIKKGKDLVHVGIKDNDTVYIKDKVLYIDNGILGLDGSRVFIDAFVDEKSNYEVKISSKKFRIKDVANLISSNIVIPNGKEIMSFFDDMKGDLNFDIKLTNSGLSGQMNVINGFVKIIPVNNLPLTVTGGQALISNRDIKLNGFKGYYGKHKKNEVTLDGVIDDYVKSVRTDIVIKGLATNEFSRDYLSPMAGVPLTLTHDTKTILFVNSIYDKIDLKWLFKLAKGKDILIDGMSISPVNYDRALVSDMHFENNILNVKSIKYYISSVLDKNSKGIKPILTIDGNFDMAKNGEAMNIGFALTKPLPSEFLNIFAGPKFFRKGTIDGHMQVINTGKTPVLDGDLRMEGVRIPSQRLSVKKGRLYTTDSLVKVEANGRFKRTPYELNGAIKNSLVLPVIIKDMNLSIDDINVEKLMTSMNSQNTDAVAKIDEKAISNATLSEDSSADDAFVFDTGLLIIENSSLKVGKGSYKELLFGNIDATMTLDKDGILKVISNRFDFAEGLSSLRVKCDLKKHEYSLALGVREVNADLIASNLLELKKEISGKARGIIALHTDDSLKMNGRMKFEIANGTIGKVGLVEYVLKVASLFRNPLAMISPSTIMDLVNIPEGNFDTISGELILKDNVAEKIMIKSKAPQLSAYIAGRYDLEHSDASLRIYTKFSNYNKGLAGVLRNISLNSLANGVSMSKNNDANYYAAELKEIPDIDAPEKDCQIFLTRVDGDVEHFNFLSSLKKIK